MTRPGNPHDCFFRESFGRSEIARDFLRHHLPVGLLDDIDLATLAIGKDSFVSPELREAYSDLVYSVRCRDGELRIYPWKSGSVHDFALHFDAPTCAAAHCNTLAASRATSSRASAGAISSS